MVALRIAGIVPESDLTGNLPRRCGRVARNDLDADTRPQALSDSRRNILAHGVLNRRHGRKVQAPGRHRLKAVRSRGLGPRHGQRPHGVVLEVQQTGGNRLVVSVCGAHRPHDLGSALHAEDLPSGDAAADDCRHVFALGREGQPVDDPRPGTQLFVILAAAAQPLEQRPFRRVADDVPLRVEEGRGVERHDLGKFPLGQRVVAHELLDVHPVLRKRSGLVGADDRHGTHRFAGVHLAHEIVGFEHPPHRERQ